MKKLTLGEKIKAARKRIGMTQQETANSIQTSFSTYRRWEKNQNVPNMKELSKIATTLQIPVSTLYDEPPQQQEATQTETLGLAYWGEVADNMRKLAQSKDSSKIATVKTILMEGFKEFELESNKALTQGSTNINMNNNYGHNMIAKIEGGN